MIADLLRRPQDLGEWTADAVRALGLLSVVVAAIWWTVTDAGILALALPALLLPRLVGARPAFDIVYGVTVLVAAWSNVLGLYELVPWWDLVVHFVATGVIAAMLFLLLARCRVVPAPGTAGFAPRVALVIVPALALALSALWEMVEWFGYTFVSDEIFVAYGDTIGDLCAGGLGGVVAGVLVTFVRLDRRARVSASVG
ncbi:hypothetical protein [Microbacterium sp. CFBP9034]|uniref:hypothetical protein n=1 Tax=Microbacterium sp. CFBP9034 TaxID=3096540 RepID=UPI002A6B46AA|nr:hypothetical protein [Microbacterium sp. CFBP9034]MDY0910678.1 hypothetical protein [Microbacterium sp. CFBP9034]